MDLARTQFKTFMASIGVIGLETLDVPDTSFLDAVQMQVDRGGVNLLRLGLDDESSASDRPFKISI